MAQARSKDEFKHDGRAPIHRGRAIAAEVRQLGDDAFDAARGKAAELRNGAKRVVASAGDSLRGARRMRRRRLVAAKNAVVGAAGSVTRIIGRNPVASVGVAAGVVLAVGLLVRRFRSRD